MYLICNHKNNLTYDEVKRLKENLKTLDNKSVKLIISPSYPYIYSFIRNSLASQDISIYDNKTGEISGKQLKSLFVEYVIIGHVERRIYFKEDIDILIEKLKKTHQNNLKAIYCFTSYDKDIPSSYNNLKKEYEMIKKYLNDDDIIAFEPEWAIGNVLNLDFDYIDKIINYLFELTNKKIVYGGSVNETTIDDLIKINNLNGFLVSTISTDTQKLQTIINKMT